MKVLIASEPGVDGVFRYVEMLCHFLVDQGVEVHLAYSDRRGCDCLTDLVRWIGDHGGRTANLATANRPAWSDWNALRALHRLARAVGPDVIHSHSSKAGFLARLLPFLGVDAVQVYNPHAYVGMRPERGRIDWLYNLIEGGLGRLGTTIAVSTDEAAFARNRLRVPPGRIHQLANGVDTGVFAPAAAGEQVSLRRRFGLPLDQPVLGFLGRSSAQKDPLTLYRAFAQASAESPLTLFHVGRGELDGELARLAQQLGIASRVVRLPYLLTPVDFYRAVDGFAMASRYEGFSLAALEALACNLPLMLSAAPGNNELLAQPLSHAWSAPPGDAGGFARAIAAWRRRLRDPTAPNHRQIARARFDLRQSLQSVLALYTQLVGAHAPERRPALASGRWS